MKKARISKDLTNRLVVKPTKRKPFWVGPHLTDFASNVWTPMNWAKQGYENESARGFVFGSTGRSIRWAQQRSGRAQTDLQIKSLLTSIRDLWKLRSLLQIKKRWVGRLWRG